MPSANSPRHYSACKEAWARQWLRDYREHLCLGPSAPLPCDRESVTTYLKDLRHRQTKPAWQRLQALRAIIGDARRQTSPHLNDLEAMADQLQRLVRRKADAEGTDTASAVVHAVGPIDPHEPRVIQGLRRTLRVRHLAYSTEKCYVNWIERFIRRFALADDPQWRRIDTRHVTEFLSAVAIEDGVSASTQNQALAALQNVFEHVLKRPLKNVDAVRAKASEYLPLVLSPAEVQRVLAELRGRNLLIGRILYGSGLRLKESLRLRIKDIDFDQKQIIVRDAKGAKSRATLLPSLTVTDLARTIELRQELHVKTTMIYTHVMRSGPCGVKSPLDRDLADSKLNDPMGSGK